jgi:hypothetical protein
MAGSGSGSEIMMVEDSSRYPSSTDDRRVDTRKPAPLDVVHGGLGLQGGMQMLELSAHTLVGTTPKATAGPCS